MIPKKRLLQLFGFLTLSLLVGCEPLAPEDGTQYVIVTDTPGSVATIPPVTPSLDSNGAVVNTPEPSATPLPTATITPSPTPVVCTDTSGTVFQDTLQSQLTGAELRFRVYLPPCFDDTLKRYPYVILLPGTGYDDMMWDELGVVPMLDEGIIAGTLPPMVAVMPGPGLMPDDGMPLSEYNDKPVDEAYEALIVDELIPTIESVEYNLCLWGSREGRAIGGISRGGFWAFSIALRYPDLFSALGGHSPYFSEDNAPPAINPLDVARRVMLGDQPLRVYMDSAESDSVNANARLMDQILDQKGIDSTYIVNPVGDHSVDYWASHLFDYLAFYSKAWPYDVNALPSCLEPSPE
jgi:enterochelin esterase-like enzyme